MECISTVSYSVLVNGAPCKPFEARQGLRQGDLMSPYLFAIAMEYLTRCLDTLNMKEGDIIQSVVELQQRLFCLQMTY